MSGRVSVRFAVEEGRGFTLVRGHLGQLSGGLSGVWVGKTGTGDRDRVRVGGGEEGRRPEEGCNTSHSPRPKQRVRAESPPRGELVATQKPSYIIRNSNDSLTFLLTHFFTCNWSQRVGQEETRPLKYSYPVVISVPFPSEWRREYLGERFLLSRPRCTSRTTVDGEEDRVGTDLVYRVRRVV